MQKLLMQMQEVLALMRLQGSCDQPRQDLRGAPAEGVESLLEEGGGDKDIHAPDISGEHGASEHEEEIDVQAGSADGISEWDHMEVDSNASDADFMGYSHPGRGG